MILKNCKCISSCFREVEFEHGEIKITIPNLLPHEDVYHIDVNYDLDLYEIAKTDIERQENESKLRVKQRKDNES